MIRVYGFPYVCIGNIFYGIRDDGDSHVDQIGRSHFENLFTKFLAISIDFLRDTIMPIIVGAKFKWLENPIYFDTHGPHYCALMTFHSFMSDVSNFFFALAEELFASN